MRSVDPCKGCVYWWCLNTLAILILFPIFSMLKCDHPIKRVVTNTQKGKNWIDLFFVLSLLRYLFIIPWSLCSVLSWLFAYPRLSRLNRMITIGSVLYFTATLTMNKKMVAYAVVYALEQALVVLEEAISPLVLLRLLTGCRLLFLKITPIVGNPTYTLVPKRICLLCIRFTASNGNIYRL